MKVTSLNNQPPAIFRWLILIFISLAMLGNYYLYDCISPLADVLKSQLKFTDSDLGLLQGIYSFPNIIMVLIGGIIIDRIGTRKSSILFASLILIGAFITVFRGNIYIMATGRLIFGLGAESLIVAITTVVAKWFKGNQLSFAFGLNLTIARLGSFLALNSPSWAKSLYNSWQGPLYISLAAAVLCILSVIIFYILDKYSDNNYSVETVDAQEKVILSDVFCFVRKRFILTIIFLTAGLLLFNTILKNEVNTLLQVFFGVLIITFTLLNFKAFTKSFWLIVMLCITFYAAMFPFQTFAVKFFQETHGITREYAGFLSSILTLAAMFCTPLFGLLSDYIGKRSLLMMFGSLLIIPVYIMMGYTSVPLMLPMCMMGIAFSLVPAILWPAVALVTSPSKLGTAYGLMTMIQNIGLFGFNIIIGWANDYSHASVINPGGYHLGMLIFSCLGFFGFIFAVLLRLNERGPNAKGLEIGIIHRKKS